MELDTIILSYIFIGTALISLFLSYFAFVNTKNSANKPLSLLLVSVSLWSLFYGLELATDNPALLSVYISLEYLGITTIPVFWLYFAATYTGSDSWISTKSILLIFIIPIITFTLVVTNSYHNLFYLTTDLFSNGDFHYHTFTPGPFYWLHIVYSYILVFIGLLMICLALVRVSKSNRTRVALVLFASLIPYLFSLLYIIGIRPNGNVDLTPIGFLVTGLLIAQGTFNKGLLDIKPLILSSLFESIPDAIIVVDLNCEISCTNPKADDMMSSGELNNTEIQKIICSDEYIMVGDETVQYIEINSAQKTFRVEKNIIYNNRKRKIGTMFMIIDITQEKKYRDALYSSEEKYRALFENAQEGIVVIQDKQLMFFNPMMLKMTGYTCEEMYGMNYKQMIHPSDVEVIENIYKKVTELQKVDEKLQFRLLGKYGSICWVEFSSVFIQWNGKRAGLLFVNNINEQKQAEELKGLLISISNTYINAPIDQLDETINNSLREMGEFVNADRSYIFDYDWEQNTCTNTYEWCAEGITAEIMNLQNISLDYLPFWVDTHKNNLPMYVDNVLALDPELGLRQVLEPQGIKSLMTLPMMDMDNCIGFVGFDSVTEFHQYTEKEKALLQVFSQMIVNLKNRKTANDLLKNQINVQQLINEVSSELVSVDNLNLDQKIKKILQQTGDFFKVDRSYILRYSENSSIESNTHEWCAEGIHSEKDSITNIKLELFPWWKNQVEKKEIIYIKDTHDLPLDAEIERNEFLRQGIRTLLCFPIINNNILMGYFGFDSVNNVRIWTESQIEVIETLSNILGDALIKVETEIEIIRSKELAEAGSKAKSNFLSNMSHEIRTPLNGVIGFTELLRSTPLSTVQKEYLENAISSANSLLGVISDILDFSKIESGKMELESIKTDIIQLLEHSSDIIKVSSSKKGLELLLNIHPNIPRFAYVDPIRTKQILVNLLSNAVKFTHQGEIELSLSFKAINANTGVFYISVRDSGIGIREEDRDKLFKAFSQADTSTTRRYGGTGLGLIISNSLAKQMGSPIQFESEYGKGTTFRFEIECKYENGEAPDYQSIENVKTVLVIDDNTSNRQILEQQFKFWNIPFVGVDSGYRGVELLQNGDDFDLIIVDYHMPDMDGLETVKQIREHLITKKANQPIIILHSSSDDLSLHEKAKALNVRFLLAKPVKKDELYYYLNSVLSDNDYEPKSITELKTEIVTDDDSNEQFCVLVAEDTQMNMLVIRNMLHTILPNIRMVEAQNGIEAIQQLKLSQPDLILMDVQMPELDGLEATRQIRRIKNGLTVPIVALSAGVSKEERELCFKAGMDDFISKPIEKNELKWLINKYLFRNSSTKQSLEIIHFNKEKLYDKIPNQDVVNNLIIMAKTEFPICIAEIKQAVLLNEITEIKQKAHKLKGSSLNMEFDKLAKILNKLELNVADKLQHEQIIADLDAEWNILSDILNT